MDIDNIFLVNLSQILSGVKLDDIDYLLENITKINDKEKKVTKKVFKELIKLVNDNKPLLKEL